MVDDIKPGDLWRWREPAVDVRYGEIDEFILILKQAGPNDMIFHHELRHWKIFFISLDPVGSRPRSGIDFLSEIEILSGLEQGDWSLISRSASEVAGVV